MWLSFNKHKCSAKLFCNLTAVCLLLPLGISLLYTSWWSAGVEILFLFTSRWFEKFSLWKNSDLSILSICPSLHHVRSVTLREWGPPGSHRLTRQHGAWPPSRMDTTADTILESMPSSSGKLVSWRLTRAHRTLSGRGKGKKNAGSSLQKDKEKFGSLGVRYKPLS